MIRIKDFLEPFDHCISYNSNTDHKNYFEIYEFLGLRSANNKIVYKKNILITTVGVKEFLHGLFLKFFGCSISQVIHDWKPHPGKKAVLILFYNFVASLIFNLVFHSRYQFKLAKKANSSFFYLPLKVLKKNSKVFKEQEKPTLISFGRNENYKNFKFFEELDESFFDKFKVVLISKGLQLKKNSKFIKVYDEYMQENELDELISNASLTILPYTSATQSGVIIKSYALGTPVAVSDIEGLSEYVTDKDLGLEFNLSEKKIDQKFLSFLRSTSMESFNKAIKDFPSLVKLSDDNF